jgi:hypothetical protein
MSKFIEGLIVDLVVNDMATIKKMKKSELIKMAEALLTDNYRELHDDSIVELYELQFDTNLARY